MKMNNLPSNWQVKSLGEVVRISKGRKLNSLVDSKTPSSRRFIQIDDLRNNEQLKYTEDNSGVLVNENDVLIAWDGANAGTVGFGLEGFIGSTIARLELLEENISTNYLGWLLRTKSKYLRDNCTGATIPHVNKSILTSVKIPLPPLPIQKQIAEKLEKADQAKQKRKEANKLTDEFLQSVFIEMFGDPVKNPKGWEVRKINDVIIEIENENPMKFVDKYYTYIDISSIDNILKSIKETRNIRGFNAPSRARQLVYKNDVLVSTVRPNLNTVTIIKKKFKNSIASTGFCVLRVKDEFIVSDYLFFITIQSFFVKHLTKISKGASYPAVTDSQIKDIKIPIPPLSLQQQFTEIVNKTEVLKEKQKQSEQELENLFQSLMQKAFKGELVA